MSDNWSDKNHPVNKNKKKQDPCISPLIMPGELQVHRHVPLNDTKISQNTKLALQNLLQEFDSVISKNSNDVGQQT